MEQAHEKADVGATFTSEAQRHGLSQALISEPDVDLLFKLLLACLDYFHLADQVAVGIVGGMLDIIEAMQKAGKR